MRQKLTRGEKGLAQTFLDRPFQTCGQRLAINLEIVAKIETGELVTAL